MIEDGPNIFLPDKHQVKKMPAVELNNCESLHMLFMSSAMIKGKIFAIFSALQSQMAFFF